MKNKIKTQLEAINSIKENVNNLDVYNRKSFMWSIF